MRLPYTFFIQYFARFMQVLSFKMKWSKKELIVQMHMQIWTWDLNTFTWVSESYHNGILSTISRDIRSAVLNHF